MSTKDIVVPDIGMTAAVAVIEVLVKVGQTITEGDSIITLESDKASMEIPASAAGTVKSVKIKVNDKVKQGDVILTLETADTKQENAAVNSESSTKQENSTKVENKSDIQNKEITVNVPDIGNAKNVAIIEILVKAGDEVNKDQSIITLESDKASMEIPASNAGKVTKLLVKVGDKVSEGDPILLLATTVTQTAEHSEEEKNTTKAAEAKPTETSEIKKSVEVTTNNASLTDIHAGPAVRKIAREFGIDLTNIKPTGPKDRILVEDVQAYVKNALRNGSAANSGLQVASAPVIDFSQFGPIAVKPLSRIKKLTGINVHRSWVTVPHVTQFDEADITEMEAFRANQKDQLEKQGIKLTPLVFLMKAVVAALKYLPQFNASLDASGENLIMKNYFHIGVAVDTPNGLVVPVVRDVDKKGLFELAAELAAISKKAREKGLALADMQGGCFTISSLGGIGGTAFTPIVNTPDVAILGVSKAQTKPVYINGQFEPRLMLPLSLSYDHRVIDGADGVRFTSYLAKMLTDIRQLLF